MIYSRHTAAGMAKMRAAHGPPSLPLPSQMGLYWEAAINPYSQLCSGLPAPLVLPTLLCVCWGILLLLRCFLPRSLCEKMKNLSAVAVLLAEMRHLEVCKLLVIPFFLSANSKQQRERDLTVFSSEIHCFTDVTRCAL